MHVLLPANFIDSALFSILCTIIITLVTYIGLFIYILYFILFSSPLLKTFTERRTFLPKRREGDAVSAGVAIN